MADSAKISGLSSREREVLELMAQGLSNQAIADRLYLSERAVEKHVSGVFRKLDLYPPRLGVNSRVLAVVTYLDEQWGA